MRLRRKRSKLGRITRLLLLWLALQSGSRIVSAQAPNVAACTGSLQPDAHALAQERIGDLNNLPHYDLDVALSSDLQAFELRETASFTNSSRGRVRDIVFVVYANVAHDPASGTPPVRLLQGRCLPPHSCRIDEIGGGYLRARLASDLQHGERLHVELTLAGQLPRLDATRTTLEGQLLESLDTISRDSKSHDHGLLAWSDGLASMGGFYAVLASRKNGTWDTSPQRALGDLTSDELAFFRVRARVPPRVRLAATGVRVDEKHARDGRRDVVFCAELVRDFAMLASEAFSTLETRARGVRVRVHVTPPARASAPRLLAPASQAIELFSDAFHAYPYREFDVVEAPLVGGVGGVEFSGLVTVARMMLRGQASSLLTHLFESGHGELPAPEEMLDMIVAHEVAHQWWHVLVGSHSREAPFVDEGLAQWSALYFLERQRGSSVAQRAERQLVMSYQMMRMAGELDRPANQPVSAFRGPLDYGGVIYGKAPLVYRELRRAVGDRTFFAALNAYSRRYAFAQAGPGAFFEILEQRGPTALVRSIARRWVYETHGDTDLGTQPSLGSLKGTKNGGGLSELLRTLQALPKKRR